MPPPRTAAADVERFGAAGLGRTGLPLTPENRDLFRRAFSPGSPVSARSGRRTTARRPTRPGSPVRPVGGRRATPTPVTPAEERRRRGIRQQLGGAVERAGQRIQQGGTRRRRRR